ncbi:MAG: hypothetical protein JNM62_15660 [Flavobacteriales bacterium]|nr:hypothetical protein [Flavobacteriales bacterium]
MSTTSTTGLPQDWAYSPSIDLELKQYTLLGYLQRVERRFGERKLYPHLEQIRTHVTDLLHLQRRKEDLALSFGGPLVGFDPSTGNTIRARPQEPTVLNVIDEIIRFAVPGLQRMHELGIDLRSEMLRHLRSFHIGVQPLHVTEGWLLLRSGHEARVYAYSIPIVQDKSTASCHRNVLTRYHGTYSLSLSTTFDHVKADLVRLYPAMPNPATFAVETDMELPCIETYMPLAKRLVHAHVMAQA